jgi:hypothetical protein
VYVKKIDSFSLTRSLALVPKLVTPAFGQGKFIRVTRNTFMVSAGLSELFRVGVCFDKVGGCWKGAV